MSKLKFNGLSACALKILACLFMLLDHIGVMLLPDVLWLRVVGRLAYPLFAYFIAEGCRYTKNKSRRFLSVFVLGIVCEAFYMLSGAPYYGNILLTFSASILLIYLLSAVKKSIPISKLRFALTLCAFLLSLVAVYFYCEYVGLDYGFFGVLAPVFALALDDIPKLSEKLYSKVDRQVVSLAMFTLGLLLITMFENVLSCQIWSLCAVLLLMLYNGQRGTYSLKYGFYLFYPLHLLVLQGLAIIMYKQ